MPCNKDYLKSLRGIFTLTETLVGVVAIGLMAGTPAGYAIAGYTDRELYFLIVSSSCFITSLIMLLCCSFHPPTADALRDTLFEIVYYTVSFVLYFTSATPPLVDVIRGLYGSHREIEVMVAAAIGLVNTALYIASFVFALKALRGSG